MKILKLALSAVLCCASLSAIAAPATTALSGCLADNTTGKDRKDLARWVFIAIASHPDMKEIATFPQSVRDNANQQMAALLTKLLTESCAVQYRAAMAEGGNAMRTSFESLGIVAMKEVMSDPSVGAATQEFVRYVDINKFMPVLQAK